MYEVQFKPKAQKFVRKLKQKKFQRQILDSTNSLKENPRPPDSICLDIEKKVYRVGKGQFRIVYQIRDKEDMVVVAKIRDRKDVYANLTQLIKNLPHLLTLT